MYIYILEDETVWWTKRKPNEQEIIAFEAGILRILNCSDTGVFELEAYTAPNGHLWTIIENKETIDA